MDNETLGAWLNAICNSTPLKVNEAVALCQLACYVTSGGRSIEDMFSAGAANIPVYRGMVKSLNEIDELMTGLIKPTVGDILDGQEGE